MLATYLAKMFKLPIDILLKANLLHKDLSKVIKKGYVLPICWKHALLEWSKINFKKIDKCSKDCLVICNLLLNAHSAFDIRGLLPLYNSGIHTFEDFCQLLTSHQQFTEQLYRLKRFLMCLNLRILHRFVI